MATSPTLSAHVSLLVVISDELHLMNTEVANEDDVSTPVPPSKSTKKKRKRKAPKAKQPTKSKQKSKQPKKSRGPVWTFPKNPLEEALSIARAIEDKNAGKPMKATVLVRAVGYNRSNDWRFLDLLRSANQYGLVTGSGQNATVSLSEIGEDVVAPSSASQRQKALTTAFRHVDDFSAVEEFYGGKHIPEDEFFENTLVRDFKVPRDRVNVFTKVFTDNLRFLKLFSSGGSIAQSPVQALPESADERAADVARSEPPRPPVP